MKTVPFRKIYLFIFLYLIQTPYSFGQNELDSIEQCIQKARNRKLALNIRKKNLNKAYLFSQKLSNDSIKADKLLSIAYGYYIYKDSTLFLKINKEATAIINTTNSSYLKGHLHWSYAYYNNRQSLLIKAYQHYDAAYTHFEKIKEKNNMGIMLQGMAEIKGKYKDYAGSEKLAVKAIKIFKETNNSYKLYVLYNYLGLLQRGMKEYDKAIEYFHKAIAYYPKLTKEVQKKKYVEVYNNIANAYFEKKAYHKALAFYNKELTNKNLRKNQYARIIHNRAYCKLKMKDTVGIGNDFENALKIRLKLGNKTDILLSKKHLSDFYLYRKDSVKALQLAREANALAKEIKNGGDYG